MTYPLSLSIKYESMAPALEPVIRQFNLDPLDCTIHPFNSGLINNTWQVSNGHARYVLQRVNDLVFKQPRLITDNISAIGEHLGKHNPDYFFILPIRSIQEELTIRHTEGYFRLFPFVDGSRTVEVVSNPNQAFEAAAQFGRFTRQLKDFDTKRLAITLPNFHNLQLRYDQFVGACRSATDERLELSRKYIDLLKSHHSILEEFKRIGQSNRFIKRVTHHDTKISNVLFDQDDKGICVIDLDTVMPGYFISDVGDMMRTYLSPVSEEEAELDRIDIRDDYFHAIVEGYLSEMNEELTKEEKAYFVYAGEFIIYMQALRFMTDYLNNDSYYGQQYEGHNLVRAINQIDLLHKLKDKESRLQKKVKEFERRYVSIG